MFRFLGRPRVSKLVEREPNEDDAEHDEQDDESGDEPDDGSTIVGSGERIDGCRELLAGYSRTLGGSVADLHPEDYYERSIELRLRYRGEQARIQISPFTGEMALERKAVVRHSPLYLFCRDQHEKTEPPPLVPDEWDPPDPVVVHPLSRQIYLEAERSVVEAQRKVVEAKPAAWFDRVATEMKQYLLSCVYFDADRIGAALRDDIFEKRPLSVEEAEAVFALLIDLAGELDQP